MSWSPPNRVESRLACERRASDLRGRPPRRATTFDVLSALDGAQARLLIRFKRVEQEGVLVDAPRLLDCVGAVEDAVPPRALGGSSWANEK